MVTADTDVAELLSLVQSTGRKEEESTKYIDSMAELVKRGMGKKLKKYCFICFGCQNEYKKL